MELAKTVTPAGQRAAALTVLAAALWACGQDAQPAPAPQPQAESTTPRRGADKRLLGTWRLDLTKVPQEALTPAFREALERSRGLPEGASVHYTFTDSEMVLSMAGVGSRQHRRWYYEILRQSGDNLELQRQAPDGKKDKMAITVTDDRMALHTGRALLRLERHK